MAVVLGSARERVPKENARQSEKEASGDESPPAREKVEPPAGISGANEGRTVHKVAFPASHVDSHAAKVIQRLTSHGFRAYLVGGGVRDLLLGFRPKDFDVATDARPHEVRRLFRNCRVIGRRFRLAHVVFGTKVIEVATFRRGPVNEAESMPEPLLEGREGERGIPRAADDAADLLIRSDNVFGEPYEDAIRRDFTINGLFYDLERAEVIDHVGGALDIERRILRTIGDPDVRLREDPVRILRAIKFSARLDMGITPELYDAMVMRREDLARAAKPRVSEEVFRLLRGGAACRSIFLAWDTGVLACVLPQLAAFLDDQPPEADFTWGRLMAIDRRHGAAELPSDAVLLAALLLGPILEVVEGARDPALAFNEFVEGMGSCLAISRRIKERMWFIVASRRRLLAGRLGRLPRRDFFADAVALFSIDQEARGSNVKIDVDVKEQAPRHRRPRSRRKPEADK